MAKKNLLHLLVEESKSYLGLEKIEQLIQTGNDLSNIPVQPLYMSIRNLPVEAKSALIPRLSKEQREAFLDIDLWTKDYLSVDDFSQWLFVYSSVPDEFKYEFVKSPEFALFLKARFNIWTFDVEDPQYPDHDYYFLTECNQLLFEYDENCEYVDQLKDAIKMLYSEEGVEKAYSYLFKIVADQIGMMTEDEYRLKKSRLQDFGFVDYYEAMELTNHFPSKKHINNFLNKTIAAKKYESTLEDDLKNQKIPYTLVSTFEKKSEKLNEELDKINNQTREDFLSFNLVKLINANVELNGGIKKGMVELTATSKETKTLLDLGLSYVSNHIDETYQQELPIFEIFSFTDLYRIGKSLIELNQRMIKKSFLQLELDETFDSFLGQYLDSFIAKTFSKEFSFQATSGEKIDINSFSHLIRWEQESNRLCQLLPYAKAFKTKLDELIKNNKIQNHFYLNYNIEDIDFPALILSSFANFYFTPSLDQLKIGVTLAEFKQFLAEYYKREKNPEWPLKIKSFLQSFGLHEIEQFDQLIEYFLSDALDGYEDYAAISSEEYKFIGGPIILISN